MIINLKTILKDTNRHNYYLYKMGYLMQSKTVQSNAFKTLIEALKEILNDANLEFDKDGITIMAMDTSHTVLVYLKLDSFKFEYYHCEKKIIIGVITILKWDLM